MHFKKQSVPKNKQSVPKKDRFYLDHLFPTAI